MTLPKIKEIKDFFKNNKKPYYFVSPTNFNLIDMHSWVNNWTNVNLINCYDNNSNNSLIPKKNVVRTFTNMEEINEFLLGSEEAQKLIKENENGSIIYLFFNSVLESMTKELNQKLILPKNELVKSIDDKISTTEIGNEADVLSVPNFLETVDSYKTLTQLASENDLGDKLVVQTPFGDSGKTTFFISSEEDYNKYSSQIESEDKVKAMKQINCVGGAIEACATKTGTFVGPLLGELIGFEELTPYKGGWCGNELYEEQYDKSVRQEIHLKTQRLGDALYKRGYKGYFEVDYLIDLDTNEIFLGEINPRITGISAMTNTSPFCQSSIPLFLFHLLEYSDEEITFSPDDYNQFSLEKGAMGVTSQVILKATHNKLKKVLSAPVSGVYEFKHDTISLIKKSSNPVDKGDNPEHFFLLRIIDKDEYTYSGADKMILFLNQKITQDRGMTLNSFAKKIIKASNDIFVLRELTDEEEQLSNMYTSPSSIKGSE
jgi:hypothetical protein